MYLAAYARRERSGKDLFRIEDDRLTSHTPSAWRGILREFRPDLIGLSALTSELGPTREVAQMMKRELPAVPILLGGPHASAVGAAALDDLPVDYVFEGEGEPAFVRFLNVWERGDRFPVEPISGLSFRRPDGSLARSLPHIEQPDVDQLPIPAYDLIDLPEYGNHRRMGYLGGRYAALFTSRGCPYRCTYCHEVFKKGFRAMGPDRMIEEMQYVIDRYGINEFEIYDDIFNADRTRVLEVCRAIVQRGLTVRLAFPNGVRADRLDEEVLVALKEAGAFYMGIAVETASARIQKEIRKHNRLDRLRENVDIASRLGIFQCGFFMLGFPTETREEALQTIEFAASLPLDMAYFFVTVPYPGTEMSVQIGAPGDFAVVPDSGVGRGDFNPNYTTRAPSGMTAEEIGRLRLYAFARFYMNPRRILRLLRYRHGGLRLMATRGATTLHWATGGLRGVRNLWPLWNPLGRLRPL
jgi:radical SAM superfamily enzyme YgiQ (UPF0313 family)